MPLCSLDFFVTISIVTTEAKKQTKKRICLSILQIENQEILEGKFRPGKIIMVYGDLDQQTNLNENKIDVSLDPLLNQSPVWRTCSNYIKQIPCCHTSVQYLITDREQTHGNMEPICFV